MKIISGKYKNRLLPTSKKLGYRPSTTKFREAVFSILSSGEFIESSPIIGARVLDLFAGSGSLSFEALSRGAASILLVDKEEGHLKMAKEFAKKINQEGKVHTLRADALNLPKLDIKYQLVFIDPPYYNGYIKQSINNLILHKLLEDKAIIVVEMSAQEQVELPVNVEIVKEKLYSNNKLLVLRYIQI